MKKCFECNKLFDPAVEREIYDELTEPAIDWDRSYNDLYCAECCYSIQMETANYDPYD